MKISCSTLALFAGLTGTALAVPLARWNMAPAGGNFPATLDQRAAAGQGIAAGNNAGAGLVHDHLITFNGLGQIFPTSASVPAAAMFVNNNLGGTHSFNAAAFAAVDGALFYPQDQYGNEFSFSGAFSLELFFKTDGNQSGTFMQLVDQGEGASRFGITCNELAAGGIVFTLTDGVETGTLELADRNYADGTWHYLVATFDPEAGGGPVATLTIANSDSTDTTSSAGFPIALTALPASNDGNLFLGRHRFPVSQEHRTFLGLIDEVQISSGLVAPADRLGRIYSIDGFAPGNVPPGVVTPPVAAATVRGGAASFSVLASGTEPLSYQWRRNAVPMANGPEVSGATSATLNLTRLTADATYDCMVTNAFGASPPAAAALTVTDPYPIARWSMDPAGGNNPATLDSRTAPGQGTASGGDGGAGLTADHLITFNGNGHTFDTTTEVPPSGMFINGNTGGLFSFNAVPMAPVDGALFYPQDLFGDEFSFRGPFSVELFFRTDGDTSTLGVQQLLTQGEGSFRYGLTLNQASPGVLRFALSNGTTTATADLAGKNYAAGQWHYVLAEFDTLSGANGAIRLRTSSEDATEATATTNLAAGFLPLPATNNGNLFIARNRFPVAEDNRNLLGLVDEVQITAGVVPAGTRLGRLASVDGPPPTSPVVNTPPAAQTIVAGGSVSFSVSASGTEPLSYQWRRGDEDLPGETAPTLVLPRTLAADAGAYTVRVTNGLAATTSNPAALTLLDPFPVARWSMSPAGGSIPAVLDLRTAAGQGLFAGGDAGAGLVADHLITFNGLAPADSFITSTEVPPAALFANGNSGGGFSYDASSLATVDGALFYPQDLYGNEFSFTAPFTVELFFRTTGDQSGGGLQQLLTQGEGRLRFSLILNEAGPGTVRFALNSGTRIEVLDLADHNYADGEWHYLRAVWDAVVGDFGVMRLHIVSTSRADVAENALGSAFLPLATANEGNLFIGRDRFPLSQDERTFLGLIDEVQISAGLPPESQMLGALRPAAASGFAITSIDRTGSSVTLTFPGQAGLTYAVEFSSTLATWSLPPIATLDGAVGMMTYTDSDPARTGSSAGFYRIKRM